MTTPSIGRPIVALVLVALVAGPAAPVVLAHADLETVIPADKSTVGRSPVQIVMTFSEPLDPAKSSIKLVDSGGSVIADGSSVDTGVPNTMRLILAGDLLPGTYTVRWISASTEDGDLDRGTTSFTVVAAPSAPPSAAASENAGPASATPTIGASVGPSASHSAAPTSPASTTSDAVVPIVVALLVLAGLGVWLLRGRSRARR